MDFYERFFLQADDGFNSRLYIHINTHQTCCVCVWVCYVSLSINLCVIFIYMQLFNLRGRSGSPPINIKPIKTNDLKKDILMVDVECEIFWQRETVPKNSLNYDLTVNKNVCYVIAVDCRELWCTWYLVCLYSPQYQCTRSTLLLFRC